MVWLCFQDSSERISMAPSQENDFGDKSRFTGVPSGYVYKSTKKRGPNANSVGKLQDKKLQLPPNFVHLSSKAERHRFINHYCSFRIFTKFRKTPHFLDSSSIAYLVRGKNFLKIGEGKYSRVYLGIRRFDKRLVAIKVLNVQESKFYHVLEESNFLQLLNGTKGVPHFLGVLPSDEEDDIRPLVIVTDFIGDINKYKVMTLERLAEGHGNRTDYNCGCHMGNDGNWYELFIKIAKTLNRIHAKGIAINDLKSDNVILLCRESKWEPYVIDFGLGREFGRNSPYDPEPHKRGQFVAPELLDETMMQLFKVSPASDVFSFGKMLQDIKYDVPSLETRNISKLCTERFPYDRPTLHVVISLLKQLIARDIKRTIFRIYD